MEAFIGTSGFFYWGWKGRFYPEELKPNQWFRYYAGVFNTVEINSTFYKFPEKRNLRRFYTQSPSDFKITVKVNRQITHEKKLKDVSQLIDRFYSEVYDGLQEKLGAVLFQMPPSFHYSEENLDRVLGSVNPEFSNVFEFRHISWWSSYIYEVFREKDILFCSVSAPRLPDDYVEINGKGYVRFHGKEKWYRYDYSEDELEVWAEKVSRSHLIYAYFNNDFGGYAPANALLFKELIQKKINNSK